MMRDLYKYILITLFASFLYSCNLSLVDEPEDLLIAKVDDKELYMSHLEPLIMGALNSKDSLALIDKLAFTWVNEQLKVIEAQGQLSDELAEIERMTQDYRRSLLNHKIDKLWVENSMDSLPKQADVENYYKSNSREFTINAPMVKGTIVKVPDSYRLQTKLSNLMGSSKENDKQDFIDICVKNGFELYEFTTWTFLSDFISILPTVKGANYEYLLKKVRKVQSMSAEGYKYYILISNFFSRGDQAPLETVNDEISRILYNQRKQDIIKSMQQELYLDALETQRIYYYNQENNTKK